jgi:Ca2+-transporting ATPase
METTERESPEVGRARERVAWHALDAEAVLERLDSSRTGLSAEEVARRLAVHGRNHIARATRVHPVRILLHQFTGALVYVLMAALVISLAIGHWQDAIVIGVVLVLNAAVGFVQQYRAEHAISALMSLVSPGATVVRDGARRAISSEELVPGDVVWLSSGDLVPADLRLLDEASLRIDEAILTGESVTVAKHPDRLEGDGALPVAERRNMAFMGTPVASGRARGVVVATGAATEIGAIAEEIRGAERAETPLQVRLSRFGRRISIAIVALAALSFGIGLLRGEPLADMFLTAVAIAVSAVPEGLPVVMTIALAVGVRRMARRRAIVRRLPAVETLGSCTVIVTDKTGTLTRNEMTVQQLWSDGALYSVTGSGLDLDGKLLRDGVEAPIGPDSPVHQMLLGALLCNEAELRREPDGAQTRGDPTEVALLVAAGKAGLDRELALERMPRLAQVPFESWRQYAASLHRVDGDETVFVKGAPEVVAAMCDTSLGADGETPIDCDAVLREAERMAAEGLRVLAVAVGRDETAAHDVLRGNPRGLALAGLVGMLDPPREEVAGAVAACRRAGLRVVMVTGDHARTAATIAARIGLPVEGEVLSGATLAGLDDDALRDELRRRSVFARVSPHDKLRIVRTLAGMGHVVAVTGDGVNDAPALKAAHVGASMGLSGTDVAKEASEIVLTDDNFATVAAAIEEGRTAFSNIRKATFFLVSSGVSELLAILGSLVLRLPLPLLPAQILWLNLVTNGVEDVALAVEPAEPEQATEPPRPVREGIISRRLLERLLIAGVVMALGTLGIFLLEWDGDPDRLGYARVAALSTLVAFQMVHVGNCRSEHRSVFTLNPFSNRFLVIGVVASMGLHVLALHLPWTQMLLGVEPLSLATWGRIGLVSLSIVAAEEIHKRARPVLRRSAGGARAWA